MTSSPHNVEPQGEDPLTTSERQRVGVLLASVTTRTLLQSLVGLCRMNDDAKLIIAELVGRLPPDELGD
jgi:hypothetical protein